MVPLRSLLDYVPLFAASVSGAAIEPRQSTATSVYKLSGSGAWIENMAVRSNGQIILTRMDNNEIWTYDPATKSGSKLLSIPNVLITSGIGEVTPDVFAVIGGNYSNARGNTAGTYGVWKLDLTGSRPKSTLVKMVKDATLLNGLAVLNNDTVLLGDSGKGAIYKVTMSTGDSSLVVQDPTMAPQGSIPFGIDGFKYHNGYAYFTNIFKNTFNKIAIDAATGKASGKVTTIYSNSPGDDFTFSPDGSTVYLATSSKNSVIKVDPSTGASTTIASVSSDTSCAFGRTSADSNVLYVRTSTGQLFSIAIT